MYLYIYIIYTYTAYCLLHYYPHCELLAASRNKRNAVRNSDSLFTYWSKASVVRQAWLSPSLTRYDLELRKRLPKLTFLVELLCSVKHNIEIDHRCLLLVTRMLHKNRQDNAEFILGFCMLPEAGTHLFVLRPCKFLALFGAI